MAYEVYVADESSLHTEKFFCIFAKSSNYGEGENWQLKIKN